MPHHHQWKILRYSREVTSSYVWSSHRIWRVHQRMEIFQFSNGGWCHSFFFGKINICTIHKSTASPKTPQETLLITPPSQFLAAKYPFWLSAHKKSKTLYAPPLISSNPCHYHVAPYPTLPMQNCCWQNAFNTKNFQPSLPGRNVVYSLIVISPSLWICKCLWKRLWGSRWDQHEWHDNCLFKLLQLDSSFKKGVEKAFNSLVETRTLNVALSCVRKENQLDSLSRQAGRKHGPKAVILFYWIMNSNIAKNYYSLFRDIIAGLFTPKRS
jgi:hypothetical protein